VDRILHDGPVLGRFDTRGKLVENAQCLKEVMAFGRMQKWAEDQDRSVYRKGMEVLHIARLHDDYRWRQIENFPSNQVEKGFQQILFVLQKAERCSIQVESKPAHHLGQVS
jgi:hypothetical protein